MAFPWKGYLGFAVAADNALFGGTQYGSATPRLLLLGGTYTPAPNTHVFVADLVPGTHEISTSGTGYARAAAPSFARATVSNERVATFGDHTFASLTAAVKYVILCLDTASDATSLLVAYADLNPTGAAIQFTSEDLKIANNVVYRWALQA